MGYLLTEGLTWRLTCPSLTEPTGDKSGEMQSSLLGRLPGRFQNVGERRLTPSSNLLPPKLDSKPSTDAAS
jgi:hypothetical protein